MHHPVLIQGTDCTPADCRFLCPACGADFGRHPAQALPHICPHQFPEAPPFIPYTPPDSPVVSALPPVSSLPPQAGTRLHSLLAEIGLTPEPGCLCDQQSARMDAGVATDDEILATMQAEAAWRGLPFSRWQGRWLIALAHRLAAADRGPSRRERARLRAIRYALHLLG